MPASSDPSFVMPVPYSLVLWRPTPDLPPSPALVTSVSKSAISVTVFSVDSRVGDARDGVRYIGDPTVINISPDEGGVWDYTEDQKLLRSVLGLDSSLTQ